MRAIVYGAAGHMGQKVIEQMANGMRGITLAAAVDKNGGPDMLHTLDEYHDGVDVIIDFSWHGAVNELLAYASAKAIPVVIATTGHTEREDGMIRRASKRIPIFHAANMSLGVALLCELAKKAASVFPNADIEIVETHHNRKLDAPSGTALMLSEEIKTVRADAVTVAGRSGQHKREKNEIGISSVRMGNVVGIHEVMVATDNETVTLRHEAHDRSLFADGALRAAQFIIGCEPGLYGMEDMLR